MAIPEKISEALIQTQLNMKTFRQAMVVLLFEWQNLETRFELTDKCFQETFPFQESASQTSSDLGSFRLSVQTPLNEVEKKEKEFRLFQENGIREMEIREDKLGFIRKEISLREKKVEEQEGLIQMEKKQIESERKSIEMRVKEIQAKEEEFDVRVKEFELKEKKLEEMKKDLELREKECDSKEKLLSPPVFQITDPSNQIIALETRSANQQISKRRLRSKAWLHFTKIVKGEGPPDKCKCNYCHRIFALCGGGTSQLLRHISEGRCLAYQKSNPALPIDEMLGQTLSQQFVDVQIEETLTSPGNVGEDPRTPLINGCEESVKQEPAVILPEPELQIQSRTEQQMAIPETCAVHNNAICENNYQPQQVKDLSKDQSGPSFDQPPLWMGNSGIPPPLSGCSVSLESSDNITRMEDPVNDCEETQLRLKKGNSDVNEKASGDTREELQILTCEVEIQCSSGDQRSHSRKRGREHIIEQNESSDVFLHSDIEDLSSPLRKHCSSNLSTFDNVNTEDVLQEVEPVSCMIPNNPAQELYGHMMDQKDLTSEGSIPE